MFLSHHQPKCEQALSTTGQHRLGQKTHKQTEFCFLYSRLSVKRFSAQSWQKIHGSPFAILILYGNIETISPPLHFIHFVSQLQSQSCAPPQQPPSPTPHFNYAVNPQVQDFCLCICLLSFHIAPPPRTAPPRPLPPLNVC